MARAYTVATSALALQVSTKWLDNTLSHFSVQGVSQSRQGVPRRLSIDSLISLAITLSLINDFNTPVAHALNIATQLKEANGRLTLSAHVSIEVEIEQLTAALLERLEHAVEIAPLPRRGRPPQKPTGRLD